jgi:hypothetical protein
MSQEKFAVGPRSRFRDQEFWAEGGMVCIENRNNTVIYVPTEANLPILEAGKRP